MVQHNHTKRLSEKTIKYNDDIEECLKSPNKHYLVCSIQNDSTYLHALERSTVKRMYSGKLSYKRFNPSSTFFTFFDEEKKKLLVYDLENETIIKEYACQKNIQDLQVPNHGTILFSYDRITYYVWNINEEKPITIQLDGKNYQPSHYPQHEQFFSFQLHVLQQYALYDVVTGTLYTFYLDGIGTELIYNTINTYAILCSTANVAIIYNIETWEEKKKIRCTNGYLNPSAQFSSCGTVAFILSRGESQKLNELIIYDITNDIIIVNNVRWVPYLSRNTLEFYKNIVIFASSSYTITLLNYKDRTRGIINTEEKITRFAVAGNTLAVSSATQTERIDINDIKFEKFEVSEYIQTKSKVENSFTLTESMRFYDREGKEVEVTLEKEGSCIIL